MSAIRENMLRLAVLTALRDAVDEEVTALRRTAQADLYELNESTGVHAVDVDLPNGERVARVSVSVTDPKPTVTDEDAFTVWVGEAHPSELVTMVRPSFQKALLARCSPVDDDTCVDNATGEVVPGVTAAGQPRRGIRLLFTKDTGRATIAQGWRDGTLAMPLLPELDG